jgi:hypothetical protein
VNADGLAKLKKISLVITGVGVAATAGLSYQYASDTGQCIEEMGGDWCRQAYYASTSYGKYVGQGILVAMIVAAVGVVMFAAWFLMKRSSNGPKTVLSPEQIELREADKEYARAVKEAEKMYRGTIKSLEKDVRAAEKAVKAAVEMGQKRVAKYQTVTLYEDRLETPQGTVAFESAGVQTEVDANGNLNIITAAFTSQTPGKPEQVEKVKQFTARISNAVMTAPNLRQEKTRAIAAANQGLEEAQGNLASGTTQAEAALAQVKQNTSRVDMARAVLAQQGVPSEA